MNINIELRSPSLLLAMLLLTSVAIQVMFAQPASAASWPIKQFEICAASPEDSEALFSGFTNPCENSADSELHKELAAYLGEVATFYESLGFRPPRIEPVVETESGQAFRIYLYDYSDNQAQAAYRSPCQPAGDFVPGDPYIRIDRHHAKAAAPIRSGGITNKGYQDIAHELFHAVQGAHSMFTDTCRVGDWIVEGTAQALGMEAARKLRNAATPSKKALERWDARQYSKRLFISYASTGKDRDNAYRTGSLWRYLAEHSTALRSGRRAGIREQTPDYSYLAKFFELPISGSYGPNGELQWLDRGLRAHLGRRGLGSHYANFTTIFSAYIQQRVTSTKDPVENLRKWIEFIYGACPAAALSPTQPIAERSFEMRALTARCLSVTSPGAGFMDLTVQVEDTDLEALKALSIGVTGTEASSRASVIGSNPASPGSWIAKWTFAVDRSKRNFLIVANAASDALNTPGGNYKFLVSLNARENNIYGPDQQESAGNTKGASAGQGSAPSSDNKSAAASPASNGKVVLSTSTEQGGGITRQPDNPVCSDPFVFRACGPSTSISLIATPTSGTDLSLSGIQGGGLAQLMGNILASAENYRQNPGYQQELRDVLRTSSGHEVSIRIPLIDYGFAGSFSNARVLVSMENNEGLQALGPADVQPGRGHRYPLSGQVTISEYTPFILRGSVSAQLVDPSRSVGTGEDASLQVEQQFTATFVVSAPWRLDERSEIVVTADDARESMAELFSSMAGAGTPSTTENAQSGVAAGGGSSASASAPAVASCNCSCNFMDSAAPGCEAQCQPVFEACTARDFSDAIQQATGAQIKNSNLRQEQRDDYAEILQQLGGSEQAINAELQMYDAMPEMTQDMFFDQRKKDLARRRGK